MTGVPFVVIGRNEGERLKRSLHSILKVTDTVIYVDSGSTDGSREFARSIGVEVLELDISRGFTMSRARNAGFKRLLEISPETELIHFVDGDCELVEGWLQKAIAFVNARPDVAAVCGRRRERNPEASIYNLLCEIEWNTPVGETYSSGGDVMMRVQPLVSVGGFNDDLIAFEEPDLCRRLRNKGWKVWRLDADMTRHDANLLLFSQWWKRHERAGYGGMVITDMCLREHDMDAARIFGRQVESSRRWVLSVFIMLLLGVPLTAAYTGWVGAVSLIGCVAVIVAVQSLRIAWISRQRSPGVGAALLYGFFTMIAKLPQTLGQWRNIIDRRKGSKAVIIEYK